LSKGQYEVKVKAGTLSPDEEAKFQAAFAMFAEWERSHKALIPRIAPFVRDQTKSDAIQPNRTNATKTQ
jgi:hypothetical protein